MDKDTLENVAQVLRNLLNSMNVFIYWDGVSEELMLAPNDSTDREDAIVLVQSRDNHGRPRS